jgi:cytosine/adenosine deaminase-related metal-dependent hydrolase
MIDVDLLLSGGTVVTMDPARRVIEDGAVAIAGDRIVAVGTREDVEAFHVGREKIDTRGHAVLPGLIDGHAHAGHGLIKTLGGGNSAVWSEACRVVYTTASPPAFWRAEARLAALERLMFGVTTGVSLLGGGDAVMRADDPAHGIAHCEGAAEIGIRNIMAIGPTRPPHPRLYATWEGGTRHDHMVDFSRQLDTVTALIETCHGKGPTGVATLMPVYRERRHEPALVAEIERQGRAIRDLGKRHGTLFHQDGHGSGSLDMAERMFGLLGPDAFMSHCTDLTDADIDAVMRTGTKIVHNPSAIASVRGYCPVPTLLERGVLVMLGSDGTAPDRSTDMFRHMFQCMRLHQRAHRDETLMPPGKLLEMVTIDAAVGLGMGGEIGSLEVGKKADVITIDLRKPHLAPRNMPIWRVVCFANGQDVDTVIVDGRVLMRGRIVPHVDIDAVIEAAEAETAAMLSRTGFSAHLAEPAEIWGRARRPMERGP